VRAQAACSPRACLVGDPAADGRGQSAAIQGRTFRFDPTAAATAGTDGSEWGGAGGLSCGSLRTGDGKGAAASSYHLQMAVH